MFSYNTKQGSSLGQNAKTPLSMFESAVCLFVYLLVCFVLVLHISYTLCSIIMLFQIDQVPYDYHRIHRHALWIMGEYANSKQDILDVTEEIKKGLGDVGSSFLLFTYICGLHVSLK